MAENEDQAEGSGRPIGELIEYFESHDMGDEWERLPEAQFDVDLQRRQRLLPLDEDLAEELAEVARARHVSSRALAESWIREKLREHAGV